MCSTPASKSDSTAVGSSNSNKVNQPRQPTGRILYDVPCKVCCDNSSGKHYGIYACDGCAGFFKRSIRRSRQYVCKSKSGTPCLVDKTHRNQCRACRLEKCFAVGMNKDAVQHERGPRTSTIRKQMAIFIDKETPLHHELMIPAPMPPMPPMQQVLPMPPMPQMPQMPPMPSMPQMPPMPPMGLRLIHPMIANDVSMQRNAFLNQQSLFHHTMFPMMQAPQPISAADSIRESGATIVLSYMKFLKNLSPFTKLPLEDQIVLFEESWREYFILAFAQYMVPINLHHLLLSYEYLNNNPRDSTREGVLREVEIFHDILSQVLVLQVDANEFVFLRAIVLYKTEFDPDCSYSSCSSEGLEVISSTSRSIQEASTVRAMQESAKQALAAYVRAYKPVPAERYRLLLQIIPVVRSVSSYTIEEIFFRSTIGSVPLRQILTDIYMQK